METPRQVIIGSHAMRHHFPDFPRDPKDLDIAVEDSQEFKSSKGLEYLHNPLLFKWVPEGSKYISSDLLLSLKMSHLFFDINWDKHMWDVQFLLKKGCQYNMDIIEELYTFWKEFHPRHRRSNLNMSKEDFFTNNINYNDGEHDNLHTFINPDPLYKRILVDGEEVTTCPKKFELLPHEDRMELVREEVYVMAWERFRDKHFMVANSKMLKKFIMQHAPLWMFPFAVENYIVLNRANRDFISQINRGLGS